MQDDGSWVLENGKYIPAFFSNKTLATINSVKKLYDSGTFDKDWALNQNSFNGREKFLSGNAASTFYTANPSLLSAYVSDWSKTFPEKKFTDSIKLIHPFKSPDGAFYNNKENFWSESYINSKVDDKKLDRILRLYDYLLSPKGKDLALLGIEGKDFVREGDRASITREKDENGIIKNLAALYPSVGMLRSGKKQRPGIDTQEI